MTKQEAILVQRLICYAATQLPPAATATSLEARQAAKDLIHASYLVLDRNEIQMSPNLLMETWRIEGVSPLQEKMGLLSNQETLA